ncbi:hypothetical protein TKK_0011140 [Trichogramma kaykai]|uniref:FHA domain-containing protein n=1 Tax=Trichogramma kaykai TaxID=54128 RepID=A0ABD2WTK5_9HYME
MSKRRESEYSYDSRNEYSREFSSKRRRDEERPRDDRSREDRSRDDRPREDRSREPRYPDNRDFDRNKHRRHDNDRNPKKNFRSSRYEQGSFKKEPSPGWGRPVKKEDEAPPQQKEAPNFATSGKLTEDLNTVNGVVIKYSEPEEARKPIRRWRLYPFKGEKALPVLYIHRQSAYLIGRDRKIADLPLDHPSISKQHAALQYRLVAYKRPNGSSGKRIRPYLIDLESANGTFINKVKLEPKRYYELQERDVVTFGFSSREYVVLHEECKGEELDDDVKE